MTHALPTRKHTTLPPPLPPLPPPPADWSPESWASRLAAHQVVYTDRAAVERAVARLREFPPLVTSGEIERLRALIASAQRGERFLLQGGDCAERIADCRPEPIARKLKILLQMSLVLAHASGAPVVRVGRFAGQYAKPRSSPLEVRQHPGGGPPLTLPSYYGDLVNREEFTFEARRPDPMRMVEGYTHAAITLNFIRALIDAGFADLHHPENWDLSFLRQAGLPPSIADEYHAITEGMLSRLRDLESARDGRAEDLSSPEFFTSHEALNLLYESAQTRRVPRRDGFYNLTTHLPWLGDRTRALDGAHVEYLRGIANPVGVKIGPACDPEEAVALVERLNPSDAPGKIILITRLGAAAVERALPPLIEALRRAGRAESVLWVCDPMHGNTVSLNENGAIPGGGAGRKTRAFADIQRELETAWEVHRACGTRLGGVHLELTGDDVTECLGGASGVTSADLARRYESPCDPRLNYEQSLELALTLARRMQRDRAKSARPPSSRTPGAR